jgi:lipoprotein
MRMAALPFVVVMLLGGCPFTMPMLMALVVMPVMMVIFVLNVRMESHSPPPFSN